MARLGILILRQEKILYFSERKSELPPLKDQRKALAIRHATAPVRSALLVPAQAARSDQISD
jgi:hypothetical protein